MKPDDVDPLTCGQDGCSAPALARYSWPGRKGELGICAEHLPVLLRVAEGLGLHLHLRPLEASS